MVGRHALGAADHRHPAGVEGLAQPVGPHLDDLGVGVVGVGDEPGLAAREAVGRARRRSCSAMHSSAMALRSPAVMSMSISRPGRTCGHVAGQAEQLVGLLAHGADHDHDLVAVAHGARHVVRDLADAIGIGDRRAAELLDDEGHGSLNATGGRPRRTNPFPGRSWSPSLVARLGVPARVACRRTGGWAVRTGSRGSRREPPRPRAWRPRRRRRSAAVRRSPAGRRGGSSAPGRCSRRAPR